jgi:hypothetical protein
MAIDPKMRIVAGIRRRALQIESRVRGIEEKNPGA